MYEGGGGGGLGPCCTTVACCFKCRGLLSAVFLPSRAFILSPKKPPTSSVNNSDMQLNLFFFYSDTNSQLSRPSQHISRPFLFFYFLISSALLFLSLYGRPAKMSFCRSFSLRINRKERGGRRAEKSMTLFTPPPHRATDTVQRTAATTLLCVLFLFIW
jgi:hypothetical protein